MENVPRTHATARSSVRTVVKTVVTLAAEAEVDEATEYGTR